MAAAMSALPRAAARVAPRGGLRLPFRTFCAASGEAAPSPAQRKLLLYTKPGCCLCDGLKEKLHAASLLAGTPYSLASLELQASNLLVPLTSQLVRPPLIQQFVLKWLPDLNLDAN
jgi:hypothetical protein